MGKKKKSNKEVLVMTFEESIKDIDIPFDLYTAITIIIDELKEHKFVFQRSEKGIQPVLFFKSDEKEEELNITVSKENLLIKQFSKENDYTKLKVIYVVKPSGRKFKLI